MARRRAQACATLIVILPREVMGKTVYPITFVGDPDVGDALFYTDHPRHRKIWETVLGEAEAVITELCGDE